MATAEPTNDDIPKDEAGECRFWKSEIERGRKYFNDWWDRSDEILDRFRDYRGNNAGVTARTSEGGEVKVKRFNILWSNVKTLFPTLYDGAPNPTVYRRYRDGDPIARVASEILQRSLLYLNDPPEETYDFDSAARAAVQDYLLPGRPITWLRYEREEEEITSSEEVPKTEDGEIQRGDDGEVITETVETKSVNVINENVKKEPVRHRDFMHMPADTWDEVLEKGWIARRMAMTKEELKDQFGPEKAANTQMTAREQNDQKTGNDMGEDAKAQEPRAEVWEIWNRPDKTVYWYSDGYNGLLDKQKDPLGLTNFYPVPRPIWSSKTANTTIPVPDAVEYWDQIEALDEITDRKWKLTTALVAKGLYKGKVGHKMQQLFDGSSRDILIPVEEDGTWVDGLKMTDLIAWVPIDIISQALAELAKQEIQVKNQIYEITGISDIMRGQVEPGEALGTHRIKGQWSSVRLQERQEEVSTYLRDIKRIEAEILSEHFSVETLMEMTNYRNSDSAQDPENVALFEQAVDLLRQDKMRNYRVDVDTVDTVFNDEAQNRTQLIELTTGLTNFLATAGELTQGPMGAPLVPVFSEISLQILRSFPGGLSRGLEEKMETAILEIEDRMQQAENAPPEPSVEEIYAQIEQLKVQADMIKANAEAQNKQTENVIELRQQDLDQLNKERDQALELREQNLKYAGGERDTLVKLLTAVRGAGNA